MVTTYKTTQHQNPADHNSHFHRLAISDPNSVFSCLIFSILGNGLEDKDSELNGSKCTQNFKCSLFRHEYHFDRQFHQA
jgi:hypothetical protein